jgi:hypothetical protein
MNVNSKCSGTPVNEHWIIWCNNIGSTAPVSATVYKRKIIINEEKYHLWFI